MVTDLFYRKAKVTNVIDGDTFDAIVDLGFHVSKKVRVRIFGIDAPERYATGGAVSTQALADLIMQQEVVVQSTQLDSFGRSLAKVYVRKDGEEINVSTYMIENHLATLYDK